MPLIDARCALCGTTNLAEPGHDPLQLNSVIICSKHAPGFVQFLIEQYRTLFEVQEKRKGCQHEQWWCQICVAAHERTHLQHISRIHNDQHSVYICADCGITRPREETCHTS